MHILQGIPPNLSVVRKQMSRAKNGRPSLLPVVRKQLSRVKKQSGDVVSR